jgi:hypothetical protein
MKPCSRSYGKTISESVYFKKFVLSSLLLLSYLPSIQKRSIKIHRHNRSRSRAKMGNSAEPAVNRCSLQNVMGKPGKTPSGKSYSNGNDQFQYHHFNSYLQSSPILRKDVVGLGNIHGALSTLFGLFTFCGCTATSVHLYDAIATLIRVA